MIYMVGHIIKEARKRRGFTQEEICHGICSVPTLSKIENGSITPAFKTIRALAERAGGVTMNLVYCAQKNEIKKYFLEMEIFHKIYHKEDLSGLLNEYSQSMCMECNLDRQMLEIIKMVVHYEEYTADQIINLLKYTMVDVGMSVDRTIKLYSEQEMILFCALSDKLFEVGEEIESKCLLYALLRYWKDCNAELYGRSTQYLYLLNKLVILNYKIKEYRKALDICLEAIDICLKYETFYLLLEFFIHAGVLYYKLGNCEEAVRWLKRGMSLSGTLENSRVKLIKKMLAEVKTGSDISIQIK